MVASMGLHGKSTDIEVTQTWVSLVLFVKWNY